MGYRTPLETRLAKKTTKAITDFNLVEDGDRIMVGLSGGKDSWALIQILDLLRQRAPIRFSIVAVNVDSGYEGYQHQQVAAACRDRGWEFHSEHTNIGAVIDDKLDGDQTPCSLCARLRRGVLYRLAKDTGATKIALGHHLDDFIETALLNLFFAGALKAMPVRMTSDKGAHVVIRPLVYVTEAEARAYCQESELPIIGCCCPACGDLGLQRQRVKRLIAELEREHPAVKNSMIKALANVAPKYLLDRRLNPVGELSPLVAARLEEFLPPTWRRRAGGCAVDSPDAVASRQPKTVRAVVQRVSSATVTVGDRVTGKIGQGLLVLLGVEQADGPSDRQYIASKIRDLRIFADADGKMNRSVLDVRGGVLVVSQFTLAGDARNGRRPSFASAAPPPIARALYEDVVRELQTCGLQVATGEFQAMMQVSLVNDGPVTILLDSRKTF